MGQTLPKVSSIRSRKTFLKALADADGKWLDITTISGVTTSWRVIANAFIKMNYIETRRKDDRVEARITIYGRNGLAKGAFTYQQTIESLGLPADLYAQFRDLAKELGIMHLAGRGADSTLEDKERPGSAIGLVRAICNRSDPFKKWYKSIYAEST